MKCHAAQCAKLHADDGEFSCGKLCASTSKARVAADVVFGCAKGATWDLAIATITTPIAMLGAVIDSAQEGANFADWCEKSPPENCKNGLARDAAYMVNGHVGAGAELADVYTQDLIRKRGQVRAMAARDPKYRAWLVEKGLNPESKTADSTAADLLFNHAVANLGQRWTCAPASDRAALVCEAIAATLLVAKGLGPPSAKSAAGLRVAAARKLYERGRTELNRVGELSDAEKTRLANSHAIGDARVGQYSRPQIMAKYRELRRTFDAKEAKRLLKRGVAGNVTDESLARAERLEALAANETLSRDPAELAKGLEAYREFAADPEAKALLEVSANAMSVSHNLSVIRTMPPENLANAKQVSGGLKISKEQLQKNSGEYYIFYHGTSEASAQAVATKLDLRAGDGEFGSGFYLTSSRTQAQDWAQATSTTRGANSGKPAVLTYVFRRADLEKLIDSQSQLALEKGNPLFDRFVQLNKSYRKAQERPGDNPSNGIGVVYGPSISAAKGVFNQIKFSPNATNSSLFAPDNPAVAVFLN